MVRERTLIWALVFGLEFAARAVALFTGRTLFAGRDRTVAGHIRIDGASATAPHLEFACEMATEQLQSIFARQDVVEDLGLAASVDASIALRSE